MTDVITALAIIFITAGVLLIVANHFSLSPVPFFILAGLLSGTVIEEGQLLELAQWGIAFLVFVFGTQVDFGELQSVLRDSEAVAVAQLIVVAPVAFVVATLFGFDTLNAVYFAAAATLSSTIVGSRLLKGEIRSNLVYGRLASSIHFFDDLVAIGLILILSAEVFTAEVITSKIGYGVLFLVAGLLVYRHGFPLLVRLTEGFEELILMGSISILIVFLAAAELAGVSIVVGAFAAGIGIRRDGSEALGVINGLNSIRDFFVAIFFVTVGALVSIPSFEVFVVTLMLVALVLIVNPFVTMVAFTYEGYDARTAFLTTTNLNQVSELSLVIAIQALLLGTISPVMFDAIILAAAVTMLMTTFTRRYEDEIYRLLFEDFVSGQQTRKIDERSQVKDDLTDHVIVVGYGRQGRHVVEVCEENERDYVVIENDPVLWDDMRAECRNYVFGDAMSDYPWEKADLKNAQLIVSTVDHQPASEYILEFESDADVILRSQSSWKASEWLERGAIYVSVPNILASDQLLENVDRVLEDDAKEELREEHLDRLVTLERMGFGSRMGD
ncbi:cation:proton antiporter [Natronobacterium gregoryi]|uniref:Kef-type K+ transport system, membrane component n=2 Tax=Natronobacterium gregoryi TaxID=44930 RepID=L0AJP4_NATGS|nr:cation:proton antiporter [Natronobacterium gregoryi]AFZ73654.1 Kef-type K+ transport system, membrane component [Natronobacterium gregoryi SP2]ELY67847.1 sodium/hydrogen exchanger [Natronobacterium gregoryi SP2]PLK19622.1 potassium transporter Kef [Natronobacterium gregoryi SP2]SFJ00356.1 monovalent cation:H+ antiporter-2, CPA2 family [Natronobacterium gregoryi]